MRKRHRTRVFIIVGILAAGERMSQAMQGYSELHLIPGADHAMSVLSAPIKYRELVREFLEQITGDS